MEAPRTNGWPAPRVAAAAIIAAAAFLAFFGDGRPFGSDEVWSVQAVARPPAEMIDVIRNDVHPPLYFLVLAGWTRLFGAGEIAARALSSLLYLASALALYRLVRSFWNRDAALLGACLYMSSPLALLTAHFARMYALLALLSILSTWMYLSLWLHRDRRAIAYACVNALGTFTHVWFFFLLIGQAACALPDRRRLLRIWPSLAVSTVPYCVLWAPALIRQMGKASENLAWVAPPDLALAGKLPLAYAGALLAFVPPLAWCAWKRRSKLSQALRRQPAFTLVLAMLLLSVETPLLISFWKPIFATRFTIIGLHLFVIASAVIVSRLAPARQLAALVLLLTIGSSVAAKVTSEECDALTGAGYLLRSAAAGDWVVYSSLSRLPIDYYLAKTGRGTSFNEISFPREIDRHPGYEGALESRTGLFEQEADSLVDRIARSAPGRVYYLHGYRPNIDRILLKRLSARFARVPEACVECANRTATYTRISVFTVASRAAARP